MPQSLGATRVFLNASKHARSLSSLVDINLFFGMLTSASAPRMVQLKLKVLF
jgi:hypothetical protein